MATEVKRIIIHTDGGCEGNVGPGGWAAVMRYGAAVKEISGGEPATTCNRMELSAAIEALKAIKKPFASEIEIFTDSQYLRGGITEWIHNWKLRKWRTSEKKPVQNSDLWRELDALNSELKVNWQWVKGHAGNVDNERCDRLAADAIANVRKKFSAEELVKLRDAFQQQRSATPQQPLL